MVAWFGDDLRAGSCKVRPGVQVSAKSTTPASWSVNGVSRASAFLVSRDDQDRPVYGGTPSDFAVVQAIQEMKARGLRVTFYPFILMDVPPGSTLPNPYSDSAAETGQPAFPWRGRITCSPAAGYAGSVDKTATAASQVAALFGAATPASFSVSGQTVSWAGPSGDWGLRRMVLHYAHLCAAAGGVGAPDTVLMDLPQLTEDQPAHRPMVAAHAVPWPGEIGVFRSPSNDGFELLTTFGSRARIGMLASDFYAGPTSRFDFGNALVVDLLTGTLESITDLTLFGGANALAIESAPGIWEIVQAGAAELLAPGRYRLTRLLRGQRGTEGAMGNPAPAGARVVVLDASLASLPIAEADLGIPWNWRIGPASRPVSDETYVAQDFTPEGVGLRPFSVAHVEQPWRKPRSPGHLTIRWTRRSRALAADSWGGLEVPLAEELEAYEVEILDGATVKRVLSTVTTSALYTSAQQIADWGAPLSPGDTLDIRIYQLSALVGRGAPKTVTLTF